jgi:hypothetical protein
MLKNPLPPFVFSNHKKYVVVWRFCVGEKWQNHVWQFTCHLCNLVGILLLLILIHIRFKYVFFLLWFVRESECVNEWENEWMYVKVITFCWKLFIHQNNNKIWRQQYPNMGFFSTSLILVIFSIPLFVPLTKCETNSLLLSILFILFSL